MKHFLKIINATDAFSYNCNHKSKHLLEKYDTGEDICADVTDSDKHPKNQLFDKEQLCPKSVVPKSGEVRSQQWEQQ